MTQLEMTEVNLESWFPSPALCVCVYARTHVCTASCFQLHYLHKEKNYPDAFQGLWETQVQHTLWSCLAG